MYCLVVSTLLKKISRLGLLLPIYGKHETTSCSKPPILIYLYIYLLVIKHGNGKFLWMEVFKGKSLIDGPFSIAMFDYRRLYTYIYICIYLYIHYIWRFPKMGIPPSGGHPWHPPGGSGSSAGFLDMWPWRWDMGSLGFLEDYWIMVGLNWIFLRWVMSHGSIFCWTFSDCVGSTRWGLFKSTTLNSG